MSSSTEIDASKLATKQSQDKDVKSFVHDMLVDHTRLTMQLKMAAPHGVTVPKDNSDTTVLDSLKGLRVKDFDATYIKTVGVEDTRRRSRRSKGSAGRPERGSEAGGTEGIADDSGASEDGAGLGVEKGRAVNCVAPRNDDLLCTRRGAGFLRVRLPPPVEVIVDSIRAVDA